jgi:hypothetical protein
MFCASTLISSQQWSLTGSKSHELARISNIQIYNFGTSHKYKEMQLLIFLLSITFYITYTTYLSTISQLTISIHWPCYCTVYVYIVIHFNDSEWSFKTGRKSVQVFIIFFYSSIAIHFLYSYVWMQNNTVINS